MWVFSESTRAMIGRVRTGCSLMGMSSWAGLPLPRGLQMAVYVLLSALPLWPGYLSALRTADIPGTGCLPHWGGIGFPSRGTFKVADLPYGHQSREHAGWGSSWQYWLAMLPADRVDYSLGRVLRSTIAGAPPLNNPHFFVVFAQITPFWLILPLIILFEVARHLCHLPCKYK